MVQRVGEPWIKEQTKHNFFDIWMSKRRSHAASAIARSRFAVQNQAGVEKFVIEMRTDLDDNDQGMKNGTIKQIYGAGISQRRS